MYNREITETAKLFAAMIECPVEDLMEITIEPGAVSITKRTLVPDDSGDLQRVKITHQIPWDFERERAHG